MNRIFIPIVALMLWTPFACATRQEQFLKAHLLYDKQDYAAALQAYDAIDDKDSAVWYDMGNCAYHLTQYDNALLYWRKAERGAPAALQKHIAYNIKQAAQYVSDVAIKHPHSIAHNTWMRYVMPHSLLFWQIIFLTLFAVCMLMFGYYFFAARGLLMSVLVLLLFFAGIALYTRRHFFVQRYAVVMQTADIFVGPHKKYHTITQVPAGSEVTIIEWRDDGWHKVRYHKVVGWMFADTLSEI